MPVIRVEMLTGRTAEQKRALVKEMTDRFVANCGGAPSSVQIVITEVATSEWSVGGQLVSDRSP